MSGFQVSNDYETIQWNAEKKLIWADFKGEIPKNSRAAATTASGITYRYSANGNSDDFEVRFDVKAIFYPNKSWYNPELCDNVILGHEQLHFDISAIYAQKLKKRLEKGSYNRSNVRAKVRKIYNQINEELNDFQNQYDSETNFSRNREKQIIWNQKIADLLQTK